MEVTAQREADLHNAVGAELKTIGHSAETVPAHELPVLEELGDAANTALYSVSTGVGNLFHGEGPNTGVRTVEGKSWLRSLKDRAAGKFKMFHDKNQKSV